MYPSQLLPPQERTQTADVRVNTLFDMTPSRTRVDLSTVPDASRVPGPTGAPVGELE